MRKSTCTITIFAAFSLLLAACAPFSAQSSLGNAPALARLVAGFIRRPVVGAAPTAANVSYYPKPPGKDPRDTSLDVYTNAGWSDHPIVIFVHGGGWRAGDKRGVTYKPKAFNDAGYVFISVNYRLLPEADVHTQAQDLARAIAWVNENAAKYGSDGSRITLMGHSAGAHLVSLVGTDPAYLDEQGLSLKALRGVISLDSQAYDIPALMKSPFLLGWRIYRQAFGSKVDVWESLSPGYHVAPDQGIPSFLVAYTGSGRERSEQSEKFVQKLLESGVKAELLPAPGKTHAQINREIGLPGDAVTQAIFAFLDELD